VSDDPAGGLFSPAANGLRGSLRPPGDKSVSHRASCWRRERRTVTVTGFLRSADTLATVAAVRALGVEIEELDERLVVHGRGWEGLSEPENVIDVANSGTLLRLLPGLLASRDFLCVLTGDASIRRRPMARVLEPLAAMGVTVVGRSGNRLPPIALRGGTLWGITHRMPVASAQVKSRYWLAGLRASGQTTVIEPAASRDHTERMIVYGGARVEREGAAGGTRHHKGVAAGAAENGGALRAGRLQLPAFFLVAADPRAGIRGDPGQRWLNPTRTGLLPVLQRMGADVTAKEEEAPGSEPVGTLIARYSELRATDIGAAEVPSLIDELPLFLLAAAKADGCQGCGGRRSCVPRRATVSRRWPPSSEPWTWSHGVSRRHGCDG